MHCSHPLTSRPRHAGTRLGWGTRGGRGTARDDEFGAGWAQWQRWEASVLSAAQPRCETKERWKATHLVQQKPGRPSRVCTAAHVCQLLTAYCDSLRLARTALRTHIEHCSPPVTCPSVYRPHPRPSAFPLSRNPSSHNSFAPASLPIPLRSHTPSLPTLLTIPRTPFLPAPIPFRTPPAHLLCPSPLPPFQHAPQSAWWKAPPASIPPTSAPSTHRSPPGGR